MNNQYSEQFLDEGMDIASRVVTQRFDVRIFVNGDFLCERGVSQVGKTSALTGIKIVADAYGRSSLITDHPIYGPELIGIGQYEKKNQGDGWSIFCDDGPISQSAGFVYPPGYSHVVASYGECPILTINMDAMKLGGNISGTVEGYDWKNCYTTSTAKVFMQDVLDPSTTFFAATADEQGHFSFPSPERGVFRIWAELEGRRFISVPHSIVISEFGDKISE